METGLTKNQILSELSRSPHGKLEEYIPTTLKAASTEPEFLAHLIAWNQDKGQIRDSKVAIPLITTAVKGYPADLLDNSYAHLALLNPRSLAKGYEFVLKNGMRTWSFVRFVERYLRNKEADRKGWDYLGIQHRHSLKTLYAQSHTKPADWVDQILFKGIYPKNSVFEKVTQLKNMSPVEAAATILKYKIPFLIANGAVGKTLKDENVVLALINQMSPTEIVTNMKLLEKLGVKTNPALKGALEKALEKTAKSSKNVLKTTRAAEAMGDTKLTEKLRGVQEKQIDSMKVEGDWLVLGDRSGSMSTAIQLATQVAGTLAKMVKGKVWLVFFDSTPQTMDVTGLPLDEIQKRVRHIGAGGQTSIGCGLQRMMETNTNVDGIVIVSDGGENHPPYFYDVYKKYSKKFDKEVPIYFYLCGNDSSSGFFNQARMEGIDIQKFDLLQGVDYYSLPNMVTTMRTNRYSLIDEIMSYPLLTLEEAFKSDRKEEVAYAGQL